jgi:methylenetetrahydrofolate dehydrogenase (NADP+)/methenyltetrahydrofolate cyclohydrolase
MAQAVGKWVLHIPPVLARVTFFCMWHLTAGKIPTAPGAWKGYSYPIVVDGSKISRTLGYQYKVEGKDAFVYTDGRYESVVPPQMSRPLTLGFVRSGTDLVAKKYVNMKSKTAREIGVNVIEIALEDGATTEDAMHAVAELSQKADGILVQMPLSKRIDAARVIASIPTEKDVDVMNGSKNIILAPVPAAIREIFERMGVVVAGKHVAVIGAGKLVGQPTAEWLQKEGAVVSISTRESTHVADTTKNADIIVLGAGKVGILTPDMVKEGVVIIDAGTTEAEGEVRGDADPTCAEKASIFTPVPGGVGPVSVAMIFKNLATLATSGQSAKSE